MQLFDLSCYLENRTRSLFRFESGVCRNAVSLDRKHACAFAAGLHTTGGGWLEDETCAGIRSLAFDKCSTGNTPDFYIARRRFDLDDLADHRDRFVTPGGEVVQDVGRFH